jgi:hypothetical protein
MKPATKRRVFISAVFVAVVVIISLFLPREKSISIDFSEGKPWRYEQLTAPFDFAVAKSDAALERERAEVLAAQRPYFAKEASVGVSAVDSFSAFYHRELNYIVSGKLQQKIVDQLGRIYSNGIIGSNDWNKIPVITLG